MSCCSNTFDVNFGDNTAEMDYRISIAQKRFSYLTHIWDGRSLPIALKLSLYKALICSTLTKCSETWRQNRSEYWMAVTLNISTLSTSTSAHHHPPIVSRRRSFHHICVCLGVRVCRIVAIFVVFGEPGKIRVLFFYKAFRCVQSGTTTHPSWSQLSIDLI